MDPRQRGLFAAAWALGYIATFARTDIESVAVGMPTGPLGIIYRKNDYSQPYYDKLSGPAVYPAFHVVSGLTRGAGRKLVYAESADAARVQCLAYRAERGTTLWIANLTAQDQMVALHRAKGAVYGTMLDEQTFVRATTDPRGFQAAYSMVKDPAKLRLKAYAVAILSIND
jgi:hypothetical protein